MKNHFPEQAYVEALLTDLEGDLPLAQGRPLQSVFFGGGTPSLFSAKSIAQLLEAAQNRLGFSDHIEITLETNPGTVEQNKFADFYGAGVNRLSLGVQSFNNHQLQRLGRTHSGVEARQAIESALKAGISNFNLDLMHGLPQQSVDDALKDLQIAMEFEPTHLSWYQLTLEANTHFHKHPPVLPTEEAIEMMGTQGQALLAEKGYQQYEVSAWSQAGQQSRHNLNYWQFGDYLGIGAGAHGKITLSQEQQIIRNRKTRVPADYLDPVSSSTRLHETVRPEEIPGEFMLNALRLNKGFSVSQFERSTGLPIEVLATQLDRACAEGLLTRGSEIQPTEQGRRFLDNLIEYFI